MWERLSSRDDRGEEHLRHSEWITMHEQKRKCLERKGWRGGSAAEFLELSPDEEAYVELLLRISDGLKKRHVGLTLPRA